MDFVPGETESLAGSVRRTRACRRPQPHQDVGSGRPCGSATCWRTRPSSTGCGSTNRCGRSPLPPSLPLLPARQHRRSPRQTPPHAPPNWQGRPSPPSSPRCPACGSPLERGPTSCSCRCPSSEKPWQPRVLPYAAATPFPVSARTGPGSLSRRQRWRRPFVAGAVLSTASRPETLDRAQRRRWAEPVARPSRPGSRVDRAAASLAEVWSPPLFLDTSTCTSYEAISAASSSTVYGPRSCSSVTRAGSGPGRRRRWCGPGTSWASAANSCQAAAAGGEEDAARRQLAYEIAPPHEVRPRDATRRPARRPRPAAAARTTALRPLPPRGRRGP